MFSIEIFRELMTTLIVNFDFNVGYYYNNAMILTQILHCQI